MLGGGVDAATLVAALGPAPRHSPLSRSTPTHMNLLLSIDKNKNSDLVRPRPGRQEAQHPLLRGAWYYAEFIPATRHMSHLSMDSHEFISFDHVSIGQRKNAGPVRSRPRR